LNEAVEHEKNRSSITSSEEQSIKQLVALAKEGKLIPCGKVVGIISRI